MADDPVRQKKNPLPSDDDSLFSDSSVDLDKFGKDIDDMSDTGIFSDDQDLLLLKEQDEDKLMRRIRVKLDH